MRSVWSRADQLFGWLYEMGFEQSAAGRWIDQSEHAANPCRQTSPRSSSSTIHGYVAAKKKTWEERQKELASSTKTRTSRKIMNDLTFEDEEIPANDIAPAGGGTLFADDEFQNE